MLCQIILVDIFIGEEEKEDVMDVVKMRSKFINNYEKKLVADAEKNGINKGKREIARKMLKDKVPTEKIMAYTGLTLKTIESL